MGRTFAKAAAARAANQKSSRCTSWVLRNGSSNGDFSSTSRTRSAREGTFVWAAPPAARGPYPAGSSTPTYRPGSQPVKAGGSLPTSALAEPGRSSTTPPARRCAAPTARLSRRDAARECRGDKAMSPRETGARTRRSTSPAHRDRIQACSRTGPSPPSRETVWKANPSCEPSVSRGFLTRLSSPRPPICNFQFAICNLQFFRALETSIANCKLTDRHARPPAVFG